MKDGEEGEEIRCKREDNKETGNVHKTHILGGTVKGRRGGQMKRKWGKTGC